MNRGKWFDNFKCDICGTATDFGIGSNDHIKDKHSGKWLNNFKCDFCGMMADSGMGLNSHIKAKHIVFMGFLQADGGQE